ncbi:ABC transporter ATP-binding protein [Paracoccus seriniphilus]|uniref:Multiple sugar transport system ATP-binding protein n=1 Tax=Paracoccus seriniphilus TaxID=184748 RepID=A0A239Q1A1_9RHOB|nr:sn-glycerol-3-phosphate ABC transporter ATP-binding protein UgpC [Paracoccus seriniphilus]WCR16118.1 sn-glycerol-3-phosphate ABC transporter ATP-binding protein UgpC [Paracoccus seriniphilus]SNT76265.1 multiple sugar transport system ATP-binding protein [Paracoccus seriniphilus]
MIELSNVGKAYGKIEVIKSISLSIAKGEFVVLVGPSGSGKSTLLRMIAGLEGITSGDCSIAGKRVNNLPPKERGLAMVFQNYALYPHMTVFDNLAFALRVQGLSKNEIKERVARVSAIVQLDQYLDRKPSQLSGGQRQRVAMARAMVRDTGLFLFDEPLSNLDAKLRGQMRVEIRKLHDNLGATSIYVTHDQTEAMTLADRIVVLDKGNIEQVGTPHELYEDPRTRFVAGFLGSPSMNFIDGDIGNLQANEAYGVRPENIKLSPTGEDDLKIMSRLELIEYLGSSALCHCNFHGQNIVAQLPPAEASALQAGGDVELYIARDTAMKFNGNQRLAA